MSLLKNKKPVALAMLGNQEVTKALVENRIFDDHGIKLLNKDFVTVEELLRAVKENRNAEYILLSDSAFLGQENAIEEAIEEIRKQDDDIFIALFFNYTKPDSKFRNWAYGYKVYHLYCCDADGNHDFEQIMPELVERRIPVSQTQGKADKAAEAELSQKQQELEKKDEYILTLQQRLTEKETATGIVDPEAVDALRKQIDTEKELRSSAQVELTGMKNQFEHEKAVLIQQMEREKEEIRKESERAIEEARQSWESKSMESEVPRMLNSQGSITIGVFSIARGAGSTHTSSTLAEAFAQMGHAAVVVAYDGKKDLLYIKKGLADYIVPSADEKKIKLLEALNAGYTFVIVDFGSIFPLTCTGELCVNRNKEMPGREDVDELLRCQYKIAVGFSDNWNIGKLNFFVDNSLFDPMTTIFSIMGVGEAKQLNKFRLPLCEREDDLLLEILLMRLGLQRQQKKAQKGKNKERFKKSLRERECSNDVL